MPFIENQVTKNSGESLGSPASNYPVSGRRHRNMDDDQSFERQQGDGRAGFSRVNFGFSIRRQGRTRGSRRRRTGRRRWPSQASSVTRVDPTDIGFIIGTSFGNGYRLTGETSYKDVLITAGNSLASLYNAKVGAVRSWTFAQFQFPVIIDSMMTLGPLQWGATNGGTPAWAVDASTHAKTVTANLVRSNGSTYQLANFNPTTGAPASPEYYQTGGLSATSVWARGQAWALYGFVQAYQTSDNPAFLKTAEGIANYFVGHLPKTTDIPPWDFDAPASPTPAVDTSAAAIAADGPRHAEYGCGNSP